MFELGLDVLRSGPGILLVVLDEAHCIEQRMATAATNVGRVCFCLAHPHIMSNENSDCTIGCMMVAKSVWH